MVTAQGVLTRVSPNRLAVRFSIDGIVQTFNATFEPSMPPFTSNSAELTYNSVDDLTGKHSYSGHMDAQRFSLRFDNGLIITGDFNAPGVNPAARVDGTGAWESYYGA